VSDPDWRGSDSAPRSSSDHEQASFAGHVPPAPRTPSPRARNLIFKYQGAQFVFLLVGLIFTGVGSILVTALDWGLPSDIALSFFGKADTGHVLSMHPDLYTTVNGVHPTIIRFGYGDTVDESSTRDYDILQHAIVGADIPIEVFGHWARVRGSTRSMMGMWGLLFLLFPGIGLTLAFVGWRSNRREIRAFTDGRPVTARVTSVGQDYSVTVNGRHPLRMEWQFEVASQQYSGSISAMDRALFGDLTEQKEVVVLYDPMNPDVNTIWVA
jgi:hypothetical protein